LKRLGQSVVRANSARLLFVVWLEGANQQHDGNVLQVIVSFDVFTKFIAIHLRHENIGEHHVRQKFFQPLNCLPPVVHTNHADAFVGKSKIDNLLNRD